MAPLLERQKLVLSHWLHCHNYDVGVRYYPIAKYIRRLDPSKRWNILDVGSGLFGIASYLPGWKVVGIDRKIPAGVARSTPLLEGSATDLPFSDHSWDVVTCVDVLEHLSSMKRGPIVAELLRVARKLVVVAFPFGERAQDADRRMSDAYAAIGRCPPQWVSEHLEHLYPEISEVETQLENLREDTFHMEYWHIFNEHLILQSVHRYLARTFLLGYKVFTVFCSFALPLLARSSSQETSYRCIFFILINR